MKKIFFLALLSSAILLSTTACVTVKHDNGKHKGWTKNPNNPHHPNTTNPGHTKKQVSKAPAPAGKPQSKGAVKK